MLKEAQMGKQKDLSKDPSDKGQIVMARQHGQSICKTTNLVGCSHYAVIYTYQKWYKKGQPVNCHQGHEQPRITEAGRE